MGNTEVGAGTTGGSPAPGTRGTRYQVPVTSQEAVFVLSQPCHPTFTERAVWCRGQCDVCLTNCRAVQ